MNIEDWYAQAPATEQRNERSTGLGSMTTREVVELMAAEEGVVTAAVAAVGDAISVLADHIATSFLRSGRTILLGSGTSGRLAIQEVAEIPPTFGVSEDAFVAFVASRAPVGPAAVAESEDDIDGAPAALRRMGVSPEDVVVGVAASGRTPFVIAGVLHARTVGAWTCGIANNRLSPLLEVADHAVLLETGPEILTGSTRLKAGTAAKIALNRATTAAMVAAGRVTSNHMTELTASNEKLKLRAISIVVDIVAISARDAELLLSGNDWHVGRTIRSLSVPESDG